MEIRPRDRCTVNFANGEKYATRVTVEGSRVRVKKLTRAYTRGLHRVNSIPTTTTRIDARPNLDQGRTRNSPSREENEDDFVSSGRSTRFYMLYRVKTSSLFHDMKLETPRSKQWSRKHECWLVNT